MNHSDHIKHLIYRIAKEDNDAFAELYGLYYLKVLKFSGYFIKSGDVCEEVVADVFLNLWQTRKKLTKVLNIEAYIFVTTKNKAYDYLNKSLKKPYYTMEALPLEIHADNQTPLDILLTDELEQVINKAIADLPERCKLIFLMAREEGLKYREIAEILSISEKTVNAQMVTAIKKLGTTLKSFFKSE